MKRMRRDRDDGYRREEYDLNFQPVMMTFKAFLQTQDDSITDEEALHKYGEYKLEFQRQQLNEFFVNNKDYEWFQAKYHPKNIEEKSEKTKVALQKRLTAYNNLVTDSFLEDVSLDVGSEDKLVQMMDKVKIFISHVEYRYMIECF